MNQRDPTDASADDQESVVLILGDFVHEGIEAKVASLSHRVLRKELKRTKAKHWERVSNMIHELVDAGQLAAIFGYIPTPSLLYFGREEFDGVRDKLFDAMERSSTLLFVYEDNLRGVVEPLPWEYDEEDDLENDPLAHLYRDLTPEKRRQLRGPSRDEWLAENQPLIRRALGVIESLSQRRIELVPFRRRNEVTLRIIDALDDMEAGAFLRIYVPHGRYQGEQLEEFLRLLSRYLREVEGRDFTIDPQRTAAGTTYVFKSRHEGKTLDDLRAAMGRFDGFMTLVQSAPDRAEQLIQREGITRADAQFLIATYSRAFRRLALDARHELEQKRLALGQQFETDLLSIQETALLPAVREERISDLFSIAGVSGDVTVNLQGAVIAVGPRAQAYVEKLISGDVVYTAEDHAILARISESAGAEDEIQLRTQLERLKDPGTPGEAKVTAVQRLKSFLYKSARYAVTKVDEIGTDLLVAYLERFLPGGGQP